MIDLLSSGCAPHRFGHEAMATRFEIWVAGRDAAYAAQAAQAHFQEIDRMERLLSRYAEGSDVHRINRLVPGESMRISPETDRCLRLALRVQESTGGLFDVSLGRAIRARKEAPHGTHDVPLAGYPYEQVAGALVLDPERNAIARISAGPELDLGGIGKGFALDEGARSLRDDWGIGDALLSAGGSSIFAMGSADPDHAAQNPGWPVRLSGCNAALDLLLRDGAISASGTGVQGAHIVHPNGVMSPYPFRRVWVKTSCCATSDAFSTACFLMPEAGIAALARKIRVEDPAFAVFVEGSSGRPIREIG